MGAFWAGGDTLRLDHLTGPGRSRCFSWPAPLPTAGPLVSPPSYGSWGRAPGLQVDRLG